MVMEARVRPMRTRVRITDITYIICIESENIVAVRLDILIACGDRSGKFLFAGLGTFSKV